MSSIGAIREGQKGARWTQHDLDRLKLAGDTREGRAWASISKDFPGRTPQGCMQQYYLVCLKASGSRTKPGALLQSQIERFQEPPPYRAIPKHESLTAELCGDPLPGRSALDRKRHHRPGAGGHPAPFAAGAGAPRPEPALVSPGAGSLSERGES